MASCKDVLSQAWLNIRQCSNRYSRSMWEQDDFEISGVASYSVLDGHSLQLRCIRMRRIVWLRAISLAAFAFAPALEAEDVSVELDQGKTEVAFVLSDVLHTVHGTFRLKEGRVTLDPEFNLMKGEIVVDAASGSSGSNARDKRMRRDILEAQRFPEIRFNPTASIGSISPSGVSDVQITGPFLIHGQAHDITIPMHVQISQDQVTATGKFFVPYVEWGMKNPSNFLLKVNDKVEIDLKAVGRIKRASATPP
ncbi:MAG: YceI family protein [Acidobacteriaceae bacterium]|nr:YceI family protein [Acidobacteriaceae bacterium]